ncbi:MAG: hypothetical protein LQ340_007395, partial [Diploschistes diacapsis]
APAEIIVLTDRGACSFVSYRTAHYKLHYYETPTSLKFVMLTDTKMNNLRIVLHQIYVGLFVEYGEFDVTVKPARDMEVVHKASELTMGSCQESAVAG